jgi:RNA polymerase sigma-70 factor (ECF subfamily)
MMFVCCDPAIPVEAQVALALKTLCGFSPVEIARAFLTTEAAIAKRLTRAKQAIRDSKIQFEIPVGVELTERLDGVRHSLYLLFNEGYKASSGDALVRKDLCDESVRLTTLLAEHPAGNRANTHALLALMLLNAARFPTRVDGDGNLLRLKEQDRAKWDQGMIARGMFHFMQSAAGDQLTSYHLQAGIAATHCRAADYDSTDWPHILELYDQLVRLEDSPVIALNRAVVVANIHGPKAGLAAIAAIRHRGKLEQYYLLNAVLGELESQGNNPKAAAAHFREALATAGMNAEREFLQRRLAECLVDVPAV